METLEKQPRVLGIVEANLEQIKWLNDMIDRHLEKGTRQDSLTIRQMEYQREKYLKEINEYLQNYKVSLVMA
ncbi:MAG: hypothetical protein EAZ95_18830 [Bacteroidetes bacterium]|nr:MAG: hypothetical protein EAZ95_18830 [Bacteroidota bacterium]